jgi:hypothetical protein
VAKRNDGAHDRCIIGVGRYILHEGSIDLEPIDRKAL